VRQNIRKYGVLDICEFRKGFFEQTLPLFKEHCVQIFVDVDYRSSLETCLRYLWPLLQNNCLFYTHEVRHQEIAQLFFSEKWWQSELGIQPPGLIGAGTGLGLKIMTGASFNSSFGYAVKNPQKERFETIPQEAGMRIDWKAPMKLTSPDQKKVFQASDKS
jgi:hypothetical protein